MSAKPFESAIVTHISFLDREALRTIRRIRKVLLAKKAGSTDQARELREELRCIDKARCTCEELLGRKVEVLSLAV